MIVKDYITQKLQQFGINLSDADVSDMSDFGFDSDSEKTEENTRAIKLYMLRMTKEKIDTLPMSKSEGDMSVSYRERMFSFYDTLCCDLGVHNKLSQKPKITFL